MGQSWYDLLFAHWPVPVADVRAHVPPELELDLFDGEAWISVTAFEVRGTRPARRAAVAGPLAVPGAQRVRTYVTVADRPGIWFFSLDAASALAVAAPRTVYRLPYFRARMGIDTATRPGIEYRSERVDARGEPAAFRGRYEQLGGHRQRRPARSKPGWSCATASTRSTTGKSTPPTYTIARGRCRTHAPTSRSTR
jgi:uncharacterized protein